MRKSVIASLALFIMVVGATIASAATITLFQYDLNSGGGGTNLSGFDTSTGLGTIVVTVAAAGNHSVLAFFDHEIDEATNTFFNEYGEAVGAPAAGQSWEIDEPGYVYGDIYANFLAGALDNANGVPASAPDDVSMALGWTFSLAADETAYIIFRVSEIAPSSGFFLIQTDPDSPAAIYLSSNLDIRGGGGQIPEPASMILLALGLLGVIALKKRM